MTQANTKVEATLAYALAQKGKPYKWDTAGPDTFDCSGLVVAAFKAGAGLTLPHYTGSLLALGSHVSKANLQPGDIIFPEPTHVQIYLGNNQIIEAPHVNAFVRQGPVGTVWAARRLISGTSNPSAASGDSSSSTSSASITTVGNPITAAESFYDKATSALKYLTNPDFYKRNAMAFLGFVIIMLGIAFLNRKRIESVASGTAKTAVKTGEVAALL